MLKVVTGRFHPHLETSLVDHIRETKTADPFAPMAVLVPSKPLADRLRRLLAVEHRLALLNVHILTFHQLALRLADEARRNTPGYVADDVFFEQLVRHVVRGRLSDLTPIRHIGHSSGTWAALWSTVRDLKDAGIDPADALRGLDEGYFGEDDTTWLRALFSLHAAVREAGRTLHMGTADDLAESLIPVVPASSFVTTLRQALYYGFYDLTQVQLSLLDAVSRSAPTTLLFPLDDHPSFRFARRFFDRYIQPLASAGTSVVHLARAGGPTHPRPILAVRSTIGAEEELASTCRMILDLVETNGYGFEDIGVVARTLDPYQSLLKPVFDRHRVPLVTRIGRPLIHEPLCKTLLQLASLPLNDAYRTAVLDIVTSPLYRSEACTQSPEAVRPDLWILAIGALHITRGTEEWARLEAASRASLEIDEREGKQAAAVPVEIPPTVLQLLWQVVSEVLRDSASLPARGGVTELKTALRGLLDRHLYRPDESDDGQDRLRLAWEAVDRVFETLARLDAIGDDLTWGEFVELLTHVLERTTVPFERTDHQGVAVLDVMAARGLRFKALFVLGLNDKVFPRYIREDPFLRDRHRRVLDETLGFKIDEKLGGYEEEALLLTLLGQAASDRLFFSFQRADEQGRTMAPSPYLEEAARQYGMDQPPVEMIPRRLTERVARRSAMRAFLPPEDLAVWMAVSGLDPAPMLAAVGRDAESYRHGAEILSRLEDESPSLTPCDGLTGPLEAHWTRIVNRGMAPTPLERYARCPFQYFAADVLRLSPVRRPPAQEIEASLLGTVCHAALRRCYEQLIATGWPAEPVTDDTVAWCVHSSVEQAAADAEGRCRTGHYVLWELAKDRMIDLVSAAVDADAAAQADDPFVPVAFEVEAEGTLPGPADEGGVPIKIHGRVDRIDRRPDSDELRIIDYKFKIGSALKSEDRQLVQSALRGYRLQPPLYARLRLPGYPDPSQVQLFFLGPNWPVPIARSTFETAVWASETGARLHRTIDTLMSGIQAGRFYIAPDSYCDTCDFRVGCRRDHLPTWWRASRAPESAVLKALRAQRVKDE